MSKYVHSESGDHYNSDKFDSREEAVVDADDEYEGRPFSVGKVVDYGDGECFIPEVQDWVFEGLTENAHDVAGEFSEVWLEDVSIEDSNILRDKIKSAVKEWLNETNNKPDFYIVEETTQHNE